MCVGCILGASRLAEFWENFRGEQPTHEVFDHGHFIDYSSLVPLYLHGDGGRTYKRDELMVIQFQPALGFGSRLSHPNKFGQQTGINLQGHSFTTRFLTGVMPKQMYRDSLDVFDNFMVHTMSSLESLYYQGLQLPHGRVPRFLVVGLKGDLPFLAKAGHLNRTFSNIRKAPERPTSKPLVGCCWMCGAGSPNIPFEDFGTAPRWLGTCGANNALPWHSMPPWFDHVPAHVHEDRGSFFKLDILHIYHLGVGRDFGGSSLTVLLDEVYQGDSLPAKLQAMNVDLRRFCSSTNTFSGFFSSIRPRLLNLACYRLCLRRAKRLESSCVSYCRLRFGFHRSKHNELERHPCIFYNAMQSWSISFIERPSVSSIWFPSCIACTI